MPSLTLIRTEDGRIDGLNERDVKAYAKWNKRLHDLSEHGSLTFSWAEPRSGPYHRRYFAILGAIFDAQDQFDDPDRLRIWLQVGAGHCDFVPGPMGKMIPLPRSINYEKLDEMEFRPIVESVLQFIRTPQAFRFLWPHLTDFHGEQMVETILREFEG